MTDAKDAALVRLIEMYESMLLRLCYVHLRDEEQARDAVQETFLKAYRGLETFRGDASEKTWLIRIAVNTCRSMQRSAWLRYHDRRITPEELPQTVCMVSEEDMGLMCEVMQLPEKLREVIMLHYWQEMPVTEIASVLGLAQSSVSGRLKRARDRLRIMLEGSELHG